MRRIKWACEGKGVEHWHCLSRDGFGLPPDWQFEIRKTSPRRGTVYTLDLFDAQDKALITHSMRTTLSGVKLYAEGLVERYLTDPAGTLEFWQETRNRFHVLLAQLQKEIGGK